MIKTTLICTSFALCLVAITLICHITAMAHPRWKIYEHRLSAEKTMFIGLFRRCEYMLSTTNNSFNKHNLVCDANEYCYKGGRLCETQMLTCSDAENDGTNNTGHRSCDYSSIGKSLIACTSIAVGTLALSLGLIFLHILINEFKYKLHLYIAAVTVCLLIIGFTFMLVTLAVLSSTMSYDLYQYRYNLDYSSTKNPSQADETRRNITQIAATEYSVRLHWSSALEIIATIFASFTIVLQIIYVILTHRNRIG